MKPHGMDRLHRALLSVSDNAGNKASANRNFTLEPKAKPLPDLCITSADIYFEKVI